MEEKAKYTAKKKQSRLKEILVLKKELAEKLNKLNKEEQEQKELTNDAIHKRLDEVGYELAYRIERKDVFVIMNQLLQAFSNPSVQKIDLKGNVILIPKVEENGRA
jgi:hypothetical protein